MFDLLVHYLHVFLYLCRFQRHQRASQSIDTAIKILSAFDSDSTNSLKQQDQGFSSSYNSKVTVSLNSRRAMSVRPKSTYVPDDDGAGVSVTFPGHVLAAGATGGEPMLPAHPQPTPKGTKQPKEKKKVNRSSTFKLKEKKEDKKEEKEKTSGLVNVVHQQGNVAGDSMSIKSELAYVQCIRALKTSLEEILVRKG